MIVSILSCTHMLLLKVTSGPLLPSLTCSCTCQLQVFCKAIRYLTLMLNLRVPRRPCNSQVFQLHSPSGSSSSDMPCIEQLWNFAYSVSAGSFWGPLPHSRHSKSWKHPGARFTLSKLSTMKNFEDLQQIQCCRGHSRPSPISIASTWRQWKINGAYQSLKIKDQVTPSIVSKSTGWICLANSFGPQICP